MAADDYAPCFAITSAAIMLFYFFRDIPTSASACLSKVTQSNSLNHQQIDSIVNFMAVLITELPLVMKQYDNHIWIPIRCPEGLTSTQTV